jgi:hypothetical protein
MSGSTVVAFPHWIPFREACRLHSLKTAFSTLNTPANTAAFLAAAITEANAAGGSSANTWARWRVGNASRTSGSALLVCARLVPGYVGPAGSGFGQGVPTDIVTVTTGNSVGELTSTAFNSINLTGLDIDTLGWCTSAIGNLIAAGGASVSPASPTLPAGAAIVAVVYQEDTGYLGVIAAGTLSQSYFTSLSFKNRSSVVVTYTTGAATGFLSGAGTGPWTAWSWNLGANPFNQSTAYPITFT